MYVSCCWRCTEGWVFLQVKNICVRKKNHNDLVTSVMCWAGSGLYVVFSLQCSHQLIGHSIDQSISWLINVAGSRSDNVSVSFIFYFSHWYWVLYLLHFVMFFFFWKISFGNPDTVVFQVFFDVCSEICPRILYLPQNFL